MKCKKDKNEEEVLQNLWKKSPEVFDFTEKFYQMSFFELNGPGHCHDNFWLITSRPRTLTICKTFSRMVKFRISDIRRDAYENFAKNGDYSKPLQ